MALRAGPIHRRIPPGDERERLVCDDCGFVLYDNPKVVVGSVTRAADGRILLCRRAIEPRKGHWTLPAGYLELGEPTDAGARREAWEEARAEIRTGPLLALFDLPHISQLQVFFQAELVNESIEAGPESLEVGLFERGAIGGLSIAFPSVSWALRHHFAWLDAGHRWDEPPPIARTPAEGLRLPGESNATSADAAKSQGSDGAR